MYQQNLTVAARRHQRAANELLSIASAGAQPGCRAVAGYLYGVTGELAIKEIMRDSGMMPLGPEQRRDDPFYAHFPDLKTQLAKVAKGRRGDELRKLAERPDLFQFWDTDMRYAPTSDIEHKWVDNWRESAEYLVSRMDLP